jgi:hypothetical protein
MIETLIDFISSQPLICSILRFFKTKSMVKFEVYVFELFVE